MSPTVTPGLFYTPPSPMIRAYGMTAGLWLSKPDTNQVKRIILHRHHHNYVEEAWIQRGCCTHQIQCWHRILAWQRMWRRPYLPCQEDKKFIASHLCHRPYCKPYCSRAIGYMLASGHRVFRTPECSNSRTIVRVWSTLAQALLILYGYFLLELQKLQPDSMTLSGWALERGPLSPCRHHTRKFVRWCISSWRC